MTRLNRQLRRGGPSTAANAFSSHAASCNAALDDKLLSRINFERLHVPRMIFAAFFATAARIDSCADAWPRLIAASLLKKIAFCRIDFLMNNAAIR